MNKPKAGRDMTEEEHQAHRADYLVRNCEIVAEGYKLMTMVGYTGEVWKTIALCENAGIAAAIATVLAKARTLP